MKMITAIVKPVMLADVRAAMEQAGVQGLTVTDANGYGREKGRVEVYRGVAFQAEEVQRVKIEVVVDEVSVDVVVSAIVNAARTRKIGDGRVWVTHVDSFIRIGDDDRSLDDLRAFELAMA